MDPERTQEELAREKGEALRRSMVEFEAGSFRDHKPFTERANIDPQPEATKTPKAARDVRALFDQAVRDAQERQREREL